MPIPLQIATTTGLSVAELARFNAYLGVSFSKTTYFSRPVMEAYIAWACAHCRDLLVIVADHLEAYNAVVFKGLSFADAEDRTMRTGLELRRAYEKAVPPELQDRVRVRLASEILQENGCRDILELVRTVATVHPGFQRDLRGTVQIGLDGKLQSFAPNASDQDAVLPILVNYIIEEIAIILFLTSAAEPRYEISIFPYAPPRILVDLFDGAYGNAFAALTGGKPYPAIELVGEQPLRPTAIDEKHLTAEPTD
jgi:tRNA-dependent cyclodipeptide synthase